jgi:hypothetical protein
MIPSSFGRSSTANILLSCPLIGFELKVIVGDRMHFVHYFLLDSESVEMAAVGWAPVRCLCIGGTLQWVANATT